MKEKLSNFINKLNMIVTKIKDKLFSFIAFLGSKLLLLAKKLHLDSLARKLKLDKLWNKIDKKGLVNNLKKLFLLIVIPQLIFFYCQFLCNGKFVFEKGRIHLNFILIYVIIALVYSIVGKVKLALIISSVLTFIIGIINHFITAFRGTPLVPWDLFSINVALTVLPTFKFYLSKKAIYGILIFVAAIFITKKTNINPFKNGKLKILYRLLMFCFVVTFLVNFFTTDLITKFKLDENWDPKEEYHNNGLIASLFKQARNLIIEDPEGYDANAIQKIADSIVTPIAEESEDVEKPNIIVIMNESFADLKIVGDFTTNEDYMPFFHSLSTNTIKGNLHMSIFGATTPNSEWEVLTSNSMAFVPKRTVPYQQYVLRKSYSLATILKDQGYSTSAIHCYYPQGYNRNLTYPRLGFNQFLHMFTLKDLNYIREYPDDASTYRNIIDLYENKAPGEKMFNFTLTMQNHGSYTDENFQNTIIANSGEYPKLNQYLSLIRIADSALEELIGYFENQDEHTIIVLFGDHQPYVEDEFYNNLLSQNYEDITIKEATERKYITPFMIWANYDIDTKKYSDIPNLSANYLASVILDVANLQKTPYLEFLDEMRKEIPIITGNGYMDKTGVYHEFSEETEYNDLIETYHYIQFNNMFDNQNKINSLFTIP